MPNTFGNAKCVLFDLDGTLLDTAKDLGETLNFLLEKYNLPIISFAEYRLTAADGALALLTLGFKENLTSDNQDDLIKEFLAYYHDNIAKHTRFYQGIQHVLEYLNTRNIPWGIVTNKPEFLTTPLLQQFTEFKLSRVNVSGDTIPVRKPHPEPLLFACRQIPLVNTDIWYIGDAERDIEAGNAANMTTVIAKWGYIKDLSSCNDWGADFQIEHPLELLKLSRGNTTN